MLIFEQSVHTFSAYDNDIDQYLMDIELYLCNKFGQLWLQQ